METAVPNPPTADELCEHQGQQHQQQQEIHGNKQPQITLNPVLHAHFSKNRHQGQINPAFVVSSDDVISRNHEDFISTENTDTRINRERGVKGIQRTSGSGNEDKDKEISDQTHLAASNTRDVPETPQGQCICASERRNRNNKHSLTDLNDVFEILTRRRLPRVTLSEINSAAASLQERTKYSSKNVHTSKYDGKHNNAVDHSRGCFEPDHVDNSHDSLSTAVKNISDVDTVIPGKTRETAARDTSVKSGEDNLLDPNRVEFDVRLHHDKMLACDSAMSCAKTPQDDAKKVSNRPNETRHYSVFTISDAVEAKKETNLFIERL